MRFYMVSGDYTHKDGGKFGRWSFNVNSSKVAKAVKAKYPSVKVEKLIDVGQTIDIKGDSKEDVDKALAYAADAFRITD